MIASMSGDIANRVCIPTLVFMNILSQTNRASLAPHTTRRSLPFIKCAVPSHKNGDNMESGSTLYLPE